MKTKTLIIPAEVHSDDYAAEASFDAAAWFAQASPSEIAALAACDWRGDYPADAVAEWMIRKHPGVKEVFAYVRARRRVEDMGFECSVDPAAAVAWLWANAPDKARAIIAQVS